ncbi:MAG: gamma-glutamylcyclotransferase [Burkholderiales bacterium]|nr:gamma-glutamylcyclotransferase [Burkholderiales bacterium]
MKRLFVYGTLRRGGSNDIGRLVPEAKRLSVARVRGTLYDLGAYPALVISAAAGWVAGEVYAVPDAGWPRLDALEGVADDRHPDGEYFRVVASVELQDGSTAECEIYVANPAVLRLDRPIASGDWLVHAAGAGGRPG